MTGGPETPTDCDVLVVGSGAAGLAEASLALETACKNAAQASGGLSELEPGLAQFLAQLETVIGALSTIFGPPAA